MISSAVAPGRAACKLKSCAGSSDVATRRPPATLGSNTACGRGCVVQASKRTPMVLAASLASVQRIQQTQQSWLLSGLDVAHDPQHHLSWLGRDDKEQLYSLHQLQNEQQNAMRQLMDLKQLAAAEAAEAAELEAARSLEGLAADISMASNVPASTLNPRTLDAPREAISAAVAMHVEEKLSMQEAADGLQLVHWADHLITHHLPKLQHSSNHVSLPQAAASSTMPPVSQLLETANGAKLVQWADGLITKHLGQSKLDAQLSDSHSTKLLSRMQQLWEIEMSKFREEEEFVLQELAALQQQHLSLAASSQQQLQWSRALANVRVLANVSAAVYKNLIAEVSPAAAASSAVSAPPRMAPYNPSFDMEYVEHPKPTPEFVERSTPAPQQTALLHNPSFKIESVEYSAPTPVFVEQPMPAPQQTALLPAEPATLSPRASDAKQLPESRAVEAVRVHAATPAATQPARAKATIRRPQDPPGWDVVGQLLRHCSRQVEQRRRRGVAVSA